jgi:hypothetical protein
MKSIPLILSATMAGLLTGCISTPITLSPVGPNPAGSESAGPNGQLEVFSALEGRTEGDNPTWFQHSDYYVYTRGGKLWKHVWNTVGHYEEAPRRITLPVGTYMVKARAKDYFWVELPVLIRSGQATVVHLDDMWTPPAGTSKAKVAYSPNGHPVGWSANPPDEKKE